MTRFQITTCPIVGHFHDVKLSFRDERIQSVSGYRGKPEISGNFELHEAQLVCDGREPLQSRLRSYFGVDQKTKELDKASDKMPKAPRSSKRRHTPLHVDLAQDDTLRTFGRVSQPGRRKGKGDSDEEGVSEILSLEAHQDSRVAVGSELICDD